MLVMFGMLHSANLSDSRDRCIGLFELLQDGGIEKHQFCTASDKDIPPRFDQLFGMVSTKLFTCDAVPIQNSYSNDDLMELERGFENVRETWLDDVHDCTNVLKSQDWIRMVTMNGSYIFDASEVRQKLFTEAGIDMNHNNTN